MTFSIYTSADGREAERKRNKREEPAPDNNINTYHIYIYIYIYIYIHIHTLLLLSLLLLFFLLLLLLSLLSALEGQLVHQQSYGCFSTSRSRSLSFEVPEGILTLRCAVLKATNLVVIILVGRLGLGYDVRPCEADTAQC